MKQILHHYSNKIYGNNDRNLVQNKNLAYAETIPYLKKLYLYACHKVQQKQIQTANNHTKAFSKTPADFMLDVCPYQKLVKLNK